MLTYVSAVVFPMKCAKGTEWPPVMFEPTDSSGTGIVDSVLDGMFVSLLRFTYWLVFDVLGLGMLVEPLVDLMLLRAAAAAKLGAHR